MRAIVDPEISEWGNPPARVSASESIGSGGEPGELKHLSSRRKGHQTRLREQRRAQADEAGDVERVTRTDGKGGAGRVTAPYGTRCSASLSKAGHVQACLKMGGPPS